jgi:hypothetical protein
MPTSELPPDLEPENYIHFMQMNGKQQTYTHRQL